MKMHLSGRQARRGKKSRSSQPNDLHLGRVVQRILEIEALETRLLLSGIGTGVHKKKVTFLDADGDKVTVSLKGAQKGHHPTFDIMLDGGASDNADIQSIVISGGDTATALSILVKPVKIKLPNTISGLEHGRPYTFSGGFTEVSLISSNTSLKGISANSAALDSIIINGDVIGGIAIDVGKSQYFGLTTTGGVDPLTKIDLGNVSVTGHIGSIVLHGRADFTNDLTGIITAGAGIGSINAPFSDLLAPVNVTGDLGRLSVHDILANVVTTGNIDTVQANNLLAAVKATGAFTNLVLQGNFTGTVLAGTFGNASVNGNFTGLLQAGSIGDMIVNGTLFTGTVHATTGNVGNILVSQSSTGFEGHVVSDAGSVGNLTAGFFYQAVVEAHTSIGLITANATSATVGMVHDRAFGDPAYGNLDGSIDESTFIAHTGGIAGVAAVDSMENSVLTAGGAIGDIKVTEGGLIGDLITGGSVGNLTVTQDIEHTGVEAQSGAIGNIISSAGSIHDSHFLSAGAIGNISAVDVIAVSTFYAAGNIGNIRATDLGTAGWHRDGTIDTSSFVSTGGRIGNITAISNHHNGAIYDTTFSAYSGIGAVTATATAEDSGDGIDDSDFWVTGSKLTGTVLGPITAKSIDGNGISDDTYIRAVSGNIGNVTGIGGDGYGIGDTVIVADVGNVGVVKGVSYTGGNGLQRITIQAGDGVNGTGRIAGIVGQSLTGSGIYRITASAGTGGIGDITGTSVGLYGGDGIYGSVFATSGAVDNVTGISAGGHGIYNSSLFAANGVGNILGQVTTGMGTSGIRGLLVNADTDNDGLGAIGSITGITAGSRSGISDSNFYAGNGIGAITGRATSGQGNDGIYGSFFNADMNQDGVGGIASITGTTVGYGSLGGTGNGIESSTFYAGSGIGSIYGAAKGPYSDSGISHSIFDGDIDRNGVGGIGTVTGISLAKSGGASGIKDSYFFAGDTIGNVLGTTTAPVASSGSGGVSVAGITGSYFYANAGKAATTGGVGHIGTVTGISTAVNASGWHQGIEDSGFYAGTGIGGRGYIGSVSGVANVSGGSSAVKATGIYYTTFAAGTAVDGTGHIGNVYGSGTATDNGGYGATARGINGTSIVAGGLSGTIGTVRGNAVAASASSLSDAAGLKNTWISAGGAPNGYGYISSVYGYAKATSFNGFAAGIQGVTIDAGNNVGGTGVIGSVAGVGIASGAGSTFAYGIMGTTINDGRYSGTLAGVYGTATALSTGGNATASGLGGVTATKSVADNPVIINVGTGTGPYSGTGTVTGTISGTATATAAGNASAFGIMYTTAKVGYHSGTLANVTGTAIASTSGQAGPTVTALAAGIDNSGFYAGFGYSNGSIGNVTGYARSTATGSDATALSYGINNVHLYAAAKPGGAVSGNNGIGTIGTVSGTAISTASGFTATATAIGIDRLHALAANGGYGKGYIYGVYGMGTANSTGVTKAYSTAWGITAPYDKVGKTQLYSTIYAGTGFKGYGSIGTVRGAAYTTATTSGSGANISKAYSYGIAFTKIGAGTDNFGTGKVGSVYGTVSATANGGSAYTRAYGFFGPTIKVGGAYGVLPFINEVISAYAFSANGNAKAYTGGLKGLTVIAGFGPYGYGKIAVNPATGDSVYGRATAMAIAYGTATAKANGIDTFSVFLGGGYKGTGWLGNVTGIGTATAHTTGYKGTATATANGIYDSYFSVANAYAYDPGVSSTPKAFGGTGTIGNITGTATATALADRDEANAYADAAGISGTAVYVSNAKVGGKGTGTAFGGTGTIGNVTGTAIAYAWAGGFNGYAYAYADGVVATTLAAGQAWVSTPSGVGTGGSGTIGTITGTATSTALSTLATSDAGGAFSGASGISGVIAGAGDAYSKGGVAYGGVGYINDITGTAVSDATASGKYSSARSTTYGIKNSGFFAGNSKGNTVAKGAPGATSSIGDITGTATHAYATAGKSATATAQGVGVNYLGFGGVLVEVGTATASPTKGTAVAYYGKLGNVTGSGIAIATANTALPTSTATAYASGIKNLKAYAATASAFSSTGGTGIIGSLSGVGKATASAATAMATAFGIDPSRVGSGRAEYVPAGGSDAVKQTGSGVATGGGAYAGPGTVGDVYGYAYAKATGAAANGYAYGIYGLTINAGAAGTSTTGATARGNTGSIGDMYGRAVTIVSASGSTSSVTGEAYGIKNVSANVGSASGYKAYAGTGTIGNIKGIANTSVYSSSTTGNGSYISAGAIGIYDLFADVGSGRGGARSSAKSYGAGGTGLNTIGYVFGQGTATITDASTTGSSAGISAWADGVDYVSLIAGFAHGHVAKAGQGSIADNATGIVGIASATVDTASTTGNSSGIRASAHGTSFMTASAGYAQGRRHSSDGYGKGADSMIGSLYGKGTATVTDATTTGTSSDVGAYARGVDYAWLVAGFGRGAKAYAGTGTIGNIHGIANATVDPSSTAGGSSGIYAFATGINSLTADAGTAYGGPRNASYSYANGSTGLSTIGYVFGEATATITDATTTTTGSGAGIEASATGLDGVDLIAGYARGHVAVAGQGSIADNATGIKGIGTATVDTASTAGSSSGISAYGTGVYDLFASAGYARGRRHSSTSVATGADGTIGNVYGKGAATVTDATTTGKSSDIGAFAYGLYQVDLLAGYARAYKAYAGTGIIGNIHGIANATIDPSSTASGSSGISAEAWGIDYLSANAGTAYGGPRSDVKSYAKGSTGLSTIGYVFGEATASVTDAATTGSTGAGIQARAYGLDDVNLIAGYARGHVAIAGKGSIANNATGIKGIGTATVDTASTAGDSSGITAYGAGIYDVTASAGYARSHRFTLGEYATGADGTIGNVYGKGATTVTDATTTGKSSDIKTKAEGIWNLSLDAGYARGYKAYAGTGTIGNIHGIASATIDPSSTAGGSSGIYAGAFGIDDLTANAGTAFGGPRSDAKTYARGGTGTNTIGYVYGEATATISDATTTTTTGSSAGIAAEAFGLDGISLTAGYAHGHVAIAGKGYIADNATGIKGIGTATIDPSSTAGSNSDIYAVGLGILNITARAGVAYGSTSKISGIVGTGTGAIAKIGDVYGYGNGGVTDATTTGATSDIGAAGAGVVSSSVNRLVAGNANGYVAQAGKGYVGDITGKGYASIDPSGTSKDSTTMIVTGFGIEDLYLGVSNALAGAGASGEVARTATAAQATIGNIGGYAKAEVTGTTSGNSVHVYANKVYGILDLAINAANAGDPIAPTLKGGYIATAGNSYIGSIKGHATASATATTGNHKGIVVSAGNVYGIYRVTINSSLAYGYYGGGASGKGVGAAGYSKTGVIAGYATATATDTSTYKGASGSKVLARAIGNGKTDLNASIGAGYTASTGGSHIGLFRGDGSAKATVNGVDDKQTVGAVGVGIFSLGWLDGNTYGKNVTSGTVILDGFNGTGYAKATGYYATALAAGIDPSGGKGGGGVSLAGGTHISLVTGSAKAYAVNPGTGASAKAFATAFGIYKLSLFAGPQTGGQGFIGDSGGITGYGKAVVTTNSKNEFALARGIDQSLFVAGGPTGAGSLGKISGRAYANDSATLAFAYGIRNSEFYTVGAGKGKASIGKVYGYALEATAKVVAGTQDITSQAGIIGSTFSAYTGDIGYIYLGAANKSVSTGPYYSASYNTIFSAGGSIGKITVTQGDVGDSGSRGSVDGFFAGWAVGYTYASGINAVTTGALVTGQSIGRVSVQGRFVGADLVASVGCGGDGFWGNAGDTATGGGSTGGVTIGLPAAPIQSGGAVPRHHAIEAQTLGTVTFGSLTVTLGRTVDADGSGVAGDSGDIRVRQL